MTASSSCFPGVPDSNVPLTQKALRVHCFDKSLCFPMGWQFVDDCFLLESAYAEVTTCGMDVLFRALFTTATRSELEDFFGNLV